MAIYLHAAVYYGLLVSCVVALVWLAVSFVRQRFPQKTSAPDANTVEWALDTLRPFLPADLAAQVAIEVAQGRWKSKHPDATKPPEAHP